MPETRLSPMLEQYRQIKRENQGNVLFFRLGDFYEMFAEDAKEVSALLNLTLTSRNGLPMCGIPYHAAHSYIGRLLRHGKKIAICEQVSDQISKGKKVMERRVVEVITPGTTVDEDYLDREQPNYLAGLSAGGRLCSFAYIDLSTGGFYATSFPLGDSPGDTSPDRLGQELERLQVREMLVQESLLEENPGVARALCDRPGLVLNRWADWLFDMEGSRKRLERQFGVAGLKGFGLEDDSPEILSAGALLEYLDTTAKSLLPHVRSITVYGDGEFVGIDESSQRNLEIVRNLRDGSVKFTLLEVMDETRCAMGKRLLRRRVLHPLRDLGRIRDRLDMLETLYRDQGSLGILRDFLGKTPDLERLSSRLAMDRAHGKDMLSIKNALDSCGAIKDLRDRLGLRCEFDSGPGGDSRAGGFARLMDLRDLLERGICDDPSIVLTEGKLIREGYSPELDSLRVLCDSGRKLLEAYLEEEKLVTGIPSLKIRYNRLIGYFFEVTKAHLYKVPKHFIRRQGIVGGERFSTERLVALESDINGAQDRIFEMERVLFVEIREKAKLLLGELSAEACRVAELDVAQSLARAAALRGWVRPELDDSGALEIRAARHPVVEAHLGRGEFIPNDIVLGARAHAGAESPSFAMITGPNMAGKSTYLRSAALIALMAQMGSFIPATAGRIGLCDRIYCRVGASDNLARGESTFLVEMNETACILNTAGGKSLVIMDEVGRGTGTNDGLSIAWAVSEELLGRVGCRTFFATHYHELSMLSHPRIVNRSMEVQEKDGRIIFLRRLREGPTSESYGIHVARLAGLSDAVLDRARQIMERLRERDAGLGPSGAAGGDAARPPETTTSAPAGLSRDAAAVIREIRDLDPNLITPIQALGLLGEWKQRVAGVSRPAPQPRGGGGADTTPSLFD
ncbi:MAG: DNA mismatch repair protein MutS [Treponema sp.]|nr:DNA mismatch repair protein MutS [Treponema sp.]